MQRLAIFPLLGPALVFYLIADVSSSHGLLAPHSYLIAAAAIGLSVARRHAAIGGEVRTTRLLGWLGLCAAVALLRLLSDQTLRLSVDMAEAVALSWLGAIVLEFALSMPDYVGSRRISGVATLVVYVLAAVCGVLSCFALGPELYWFGGLWLVPARYVNAAASFSGASVLVALALRAARRRLGSDPEVLAANAWGLFGLLPAAVFCLFTLIGPGWLPTWFVDSWAAVSAIALYVGHAQLLAPRRRKLLSPSMRDSVAALLTIALVAGVAAILAAGTQAGPVLVGLWVAGALLFSLGLYFVVRPSVRRLLAPEGGHLLDALSTALPDLGRAQTLDALVAMSLAALRAASGITFSKPYMYGFDPAFEGFIDAAGAPHLSERELHPALWERLRAAPGDLVVRAELERQLVRMPSVRPLVDSLRERDVLCVVPLIVEGQLEGALLLPRGERRSALTDEEQAALWAFARQVAGLLCVFSAKARAEQRANLASLESKKVHAELETLAATMHTLQADVEVLQAGRSGQAEATTLIAYSAAQRALLEQLKTFAKQPHPLLLLAEPGLRVELLARFVHARSLAADAPFITMDCAAVRAEHAYAALFGGIGPLGPEVGCLRVTGAGTLLLLDIPALPLEVQRALALALVTRRAQVQGSEDSYGAQARVIACTREDVTQLASQGRFAPELSDQLSPSSCRVPPLRECREDVGSLVLLSIDRACRRYGRGPIGIETEALAELRNYDFPGNHAELEYIIDRALSHASGLRLTMADLAVGRSMLAAGEADALHGTLDEIERRALLQALTRAGGNKSETARLLGLPRSTLHDKLRKHKLDDTTQDTQLN